MRQITLTTGEKLAFGVGFLFWFIVGLVIFVVVALNKEKQQTTKLVPFRTNSEARMGATLALAAHILNKCRALPILKVFCMCQGSSTRLTSATSDGQG